MARTGFAGPLFGLQDRGVAHHRHRARRSIGRSLRPGHITELTLPRDSPKRLLLLAGADVEALHMAGRHLLLQGDIVDL